MRNPDLEDYFHFFPNFPILYSFAEPSAYAHSFIHSLTDPFILPTFIEHLLCPEVLRLALLYGTIAIALPPCSIPSQFSQDKL